MLYEDTSMFVCIVDKSESSSGGNGPDFERLWRAESGGDGNLQVRGDNLLPCNAY